MKRSSLITIFSFVAVLCLPEFAHAATTTFLGPIISTACNCPGSAPGWGCILATLQNLISFVVGFACIIITIFIALAGFTYMTSGGSAEKRQLANKRLLNAVIGLAIVLCAYLLVDSIMKVIYNPHAAGFGPWNSILGPQPGSDCFAIRQPPSALPGLTGAATGGTGSVTGGATLPSSGSGACSASAVQTAAAAGGVTMSNTEAATIACFAGPESNCGATNQNYNWNAAHSTPPSTAWGPFQITLKGNSPCFNNSACEQAAGVSGPLNCTNAFTSGGYAIPGQLLTECQTAAANLSCSAAAADCNIKANGGSYKAWTNNKDSTAAHQACVANNGG